MNIRQLKELVLETVAKEQRKNRFQRRNNTRRRQLKRIMENARFQINEYSGVEEYYADTLKAKQPGPNATNINIFDQIGIADPNANQQLWGQLYANNITGAKVKSEPVAANAMLPTQSQIGSANSLGNLFFGNGFADDGFHISKDAKSLREAGSLTWATPILAARGKGSKVYIIDGHHRWSQAYMLDPKIQMNCTILDWPGMSADDILQAVHVAISEKTKDDGAQPYSLGKKFNGTNLLDPSEADAATLIEQYAQTLLDPTDFNPKAKGQALGGKISQAMKGWANHASGASAGKASGVRGGSTMSGLAIESWKKSGRLLTENVPGYNAKVLAQKGGSSLPLAIGGDNCTFDQYKQHFIAAIKDMQQIYASGDTSGDAPFRNMMPQADDMKKAGIEGMQVGGRGVFDHIANNQITIPKSRQPGSEDASAETNKRMAAQHDASWKKESSWRKGNLLNERIDRNTNSVLNRWKKLAGLD